MKKVEAFIRHEAFEPIRQELLERGIPSLSNSEVKGSGRQKGVVEHYRGASLTVNVRPKLKIECVVGDSEKDLVVETVLKHARTGSVGDGKIFVVPSRKRFASEPARKARTCPGPRRNGDPLRLRAAGDRPGPTFGAGLGRRNEISQGRKRGTGMRDLQEQMLAAVMDGDGLGGIAELAAHEIGGPVAIVLPGHGPAADLARRRRIAPIGEWTATRSPAGTARSPKASSSPCRSPPPAATSAG